MSNILFWSQTLIVITRFQARGVEGEVRSLHNLQRRRDSASNPPALPSSVQAPMGTTNDLLDPEGLSEKGPRIPKQGPELFTTVWSACGFEGP